jgi:copper chaperone NosL
MKHLFVISTVIFCTTIACKPSPKAIHFGEDACHFCLMTIVDERHAAELVTSKGKVFKFDAIECMVRHLQNNGQTEFAYSLVCDYDNPGSLIDAEKATYLISPGIPSPMGAFLSAFASHARAMTMQTEKDGRVYDWNGLQQTLKQ